MASALIPFLHERHTRLILDTNDKGFELFRNDPRFDYISVWNPESYPEEDRWPRLQDRVKMMESDCKRNGWDFLNLFGCFEIVGIAMDETEAFGMSEKERREKYSADYYRLHFDAAQIEMPSGWKHENTIHFSTREMRLVEHWREKNKDFFIILVAMAGSGICKVFPTWLKDFCCDIIDSLPKAKIFLAGDRDCTNEVWEYQRTVSLVPSTTKNNRSVTFKETLLMAGHSNFVFGPETGLLLGAGMLGVPKSILCTIADRRQLVAHHRNDFSLQSQATCSPCHVLAYSGRFCEKEETYGAFPICTDRFDLKQLKRTIVRLYDEWERIGTRN